MSNFINLHKIPSLKIDMTNFVQKAKEGSILNLFIFISDLTLGSYCLGIIVKYYQNNIHID